MSIKISDKWNLLLEDILTGAYFSLERFRKHDLELAGSFAFVFIPILDLVRVILYARKIGKKYAQYSDKNRNLNNSEINLIYSFATMLMHTFRALLTATAVSLLFTAAAATGLMIIFAVNAFYSVRSLGKALYYAIVKNGTKSAKHFVNFLVSGGFTVAFALILVFPQVAAPAFLAWGFAIGATALGLASKLASWWSGDKTQPKMEPSNSVGKMPHPTPPPSAAMSSSPEEAKKALRLANNVALDFKVSHNPPLRTFMMNENDPSLRQSQIDEILNSIITTAIDEFIKQGTQLTDIFYYDRDNEELNTLLKAVRQDKAKLDINKQFTLSDCRPKIQELLIELYRRILLDKDITTLIEEACPIPRKGQTEGVRNTLAMSMYEAVLEQNPRFKTYYELQAARARVAAAITHYEESDEVLKPICLTSLNDATQALETAIEEINKINPGPTTHLLVRSSLTTPTSPPIISSSPSSTLASPYMAYIPPSQ